MPLKLNVGLSRKIGEPNYGSRGGSVNLEVEVDASLATDAARLQDRIRQLFGLVRVSLAEELSNGHSPGNGHDAQGPRQEDSRPSDGSARSQDERSQPQSNSTRIATPSQVKALYAISRSQNMKLQDLLRDRFQVDRADDLTLQQASRLIDELNRSKPRTGE